MKKIYTVRACRWGDSETHSYIVGIYQSEPEAMSSAENEEKYRGGKYECEIIEFSDGNKRRVVKEPEHFRNVTLFISQQDKINRLKSELQQVTKQRDELLHDIKIKATDGRSAKGHHCSGTAACQSIIDRIESFLKSMEKNNV